MQSALLHRSRREPGKAADGPAARPASLGLTSSLDLASAVGNRAFGRLLQAKLKVGAPDDAYEQEADRVAAEIMRMPDGSTQSENPPPNTTSHVQRRVSGDSGAGIGTAPPIVQEVLSSPGRPLDIATRAFFEPRFGRDFGSVRVHTDEKAAQSARAVNAQAYTVGSHVVVGSESPGLGTSEGQSLLAHELTHVVQQATSPGPHGLQRQEPAEDREEQEPEKPERRSIPWKGDLRSTLHDFVRPHATSDSQTEMAVSTLIVEVGDRWMIFSEPPVRGLSEAELNERMFGGSFSLTRSSVEVLARSLGTSADGLWGGGSSNGEGKAIEPEWPVLENPELADILMVLLERYTNIAPDEVDATDGLTEGEVLWLIAQEPAAEVLIGLFTQNYKDFVESRGSDDVKAFGFLEETIFQQFAWRNPNAVLNLLTPGWGRSTDGEDKRFGIVHRKTGELLYDELGFPIQSDVGLLVRDKGHRTMPARDIGVELDPATRMTLDAIEQVVIAPMVDIGEMTQLVLERPDLRDRLKEKVLVQFQAEMKNLKAQELIAAFGLFVVFAGLYGLAEFLIWTKHPKAVAAGGLLKFSLRLIGTAMDIQFGETAIRYLRQSGKHLSRVRFDGNGQVDALSDRHIEAASRPICEMLKELILEVGSRKLGRLFAGAASRIHRLYIERRKVAGWLIEKMSGKRRRDETRTDGDEARTEEGRTEEGRQEEGPRRGTSAEDWRQPEGLPEEGELRQMFESSEEGGISPGRSFSLEALRAEIQQTFEPFRIRIILEPGGRVGTAVHAQVTFLQLGDGQRAAIITYPQDQRAAATIMHEIMHIEDFKDGRLQVDHNFPDLEANAPDEVLISRKNDNDQPIEVQHELGTQIGEVVNYIRDWTRWGAETSFITPKSGVIGHALNIEKLLRQRGDDPNAVMDIARRLFGREWRHFDNLLALWSRHGLGRGAAFAIRKIVRDWERAHNLPQVDPPYIN